jgi:CSLREA domain-containing protein
LALLFCGGINIDAEAATFVVDSTVDAVDATPGDGVCATSGAVCTLRAAIQESNALAGADTVNLPSGTYTLTIAGAFEDAAATGDLDITDDIVINGSAVSSTIIDANGIDRGFDILGASATFSNLTIRNGNSAGSGGGINLNFAASVTLSASTLSGNSTAAEGGGIQTGGGTLVLTNVTVSGNTASRGGGLACSGPCTLTNVTVTANTASTNGGGVFQRTAAGTVTFLNTIVANNTSSGEEDCNGTPATLISNGNNLSSDDTCDFSSPGDLENTDPLLGPLQDNGGPTFTHELLAGSPAIDAGTNTGCPAIDQRGFPRPVGVSCDIGAYEVGIDLLALTKNAFWPDGTSIPTGATIPSGVEFKYMLYINNRDIALSDVSVRDVLDPAFQYQAGTIQVDNSVPECAAAVCTAAEEQAIFTAVDGAGFLSDAVDGDVASYTGASLSVDAGASNVANAQLNINADAVWAILFSVKMP